MSARADSGPKGSPEGNPAAEIALHQDGDVTVLAASGAWDRHQAAALDRKLGELALPDGGRAIIDASDVSVMDSSGAWLLHRTRYQLKNRGIETEIRAVPDAYADLFHRVGEAALADARDRGIVPYTPHRDLVEDLGEATIGGLRAGRALLGFIGAATVTLARTARNPRRLRVTALVYHIQRTGLYAMPIVGLINFLIGIVLAYMGATQLQAFGAQIFAVDLVGIAVLREMGILLTAIVVAGRSGSAFTAQIGTMQVNQEIDAMRTIGLDPMDVLVMPRMIALAITLPALTFFADLMGLLGGGIMSILVLDISLVQFLDRLRDSVSVPIFLVGISKAPVFAVIIAVVGCYEGMKVGGSAESVGRQTTKSVVESIFLVIVFDALFAIMYSYLGI